jgi:AcrR family transcriptional regulator
MPRTKEQFEDIRAKTKHKILEHALELFAEKGFKGTSINDIAKSAGISKGLAYNYFKNKEELMLSVFGLLTKEFEVLFSSMAGESDPKKKLKRFINTTFKKLQQDEKFWQLYFHFVLLPELHKEANAIMSGFLNEAFKEMEKIFVAMKIPNAKEESKIFSGIIDGVCFHYMFDKENYPLEKMRKYIIKKYCS